MRSSCSASPRRFTSIGLQLRATAFNAAVARLLGVRVGRMLTLGWALAGLIGALAGMLASPPLLNPNSMDAIFVLGFTAAVIGGGGGRGGGGPGRGGGGRPAPRGRAQLRGRVPRQRVGRPVRPGGLGAGAD